MAFCEQAKAVYCKDDAEATRCAMAFSAASCTNPPTDCDLEDLADRAPAEKACNDFRIAVCQRDEQCQAGTYDSCLAALTTALNCTKALGVMPRYEQCLVEIPKAPCASSNLPAACKDVLLF